MLVEYDDARVLITDMKIETIKDMIPILEQVSRIQKPLIIIAEDVAGVSSQAVCAQTWTLVMSQTQVIFARILMTFESRIESLVPACPQAKRWPRSW